MYIVVGGLSYRTAPLEIREKAALSGESLTGAYRRLMREESLEGVVILTTCNRTEIYATTRQPQAASQVINSFLADLIGIDISEQSNYLYNPTCFGAIEHLFRVASGLDSMVLGETQILGQVKESWQKAQELGACDSILNTLFQKALHTGKKVRHETGLDRNAVSISYAAVELAEQELGSLKGRLVVVIGAGEMGQLAAGYLADNGASGVIVSNRSLDKAREVAERVGGQAVSLEDITQYADKADILISCTAAAHYVLKYDLVSEVMKKRRGKDLVIIDIAVPRDVEPRVRDIPGVHLFDIDDLKDVVDKNLMERREAARRAEGIIEKELRDFELWLSTQYIAPVLAALRQKAEEIREREVSRTLRRLGNVDERQARLINNLAVSITNQLLKEPINTLKDMAATENGHLYAEVVSRLFKLGLEYGEKGYEEADNWNPGQSAGTLAGPTGGR